MLNNISSYLVNRIYHTLKKNSDCATTDAAFTAWVQIWSAINGEIESKSLNIDELEKQYDVNVDNTTDLNRLFFSIETYYAYTLHIYIQCIYLKSSKILSIPTPVDTAFTASVLSNNYTSATFANTFDLGIYSWLSTHFDTDYYNILTDYINACEDNNALEINRDQGDFFRKTYESLFPKKLRHRVGAYFTPEWLCEIVYENTIDDYSTLLNKKVLEPTSGSGVFIVTLWQILRREFGNNSSLMEQACVFFSRNLVAFDKNPINVLTTKANYIRILLDLGAHISAKNQYIELQVYFSDCINETSYLDVTCKGNDSDMFLLSLAEQTFEIPAAFMRDRLENNRKLLFSSLENGNDFELFLLSLPHSISKNTYQLSDLYKFLLSKLSCSSNIYHWYKEYFINIDRQEFKGAFDYVVGNPPWVNWGTLPANYRRRIEPIWPHLGLFTGSGNTRSFSKEDLSTFITYVVCDQYLNVNGKLSFIIPQGIFQSSINSKGFRGFHIKQTNTHLKVDRVQDFTNINVFEGASSRAAAIYLTKGDKTQYPVPYEKWIKVTNKHIGEYTWFHEMRPFFDHVEYEAIPNDSNDVSSYWMITHKGMSHTIRAIEGKSSYRARAGVFTGGANAVYYQKINSFDGKLFLTENVTERAKRSFKQMQLYLEPDFIYPFLRGRDLASWYVDYDVTRAILLPHTPQTKIGPVPEAELCKIAPNTYEFFKGAREFLAGRGGITAMDKVNVNKGFYCALRVGEYTFAPYKVAWRYIHTEFTCAVIEPSALPDGSIKPSIPQEKLMIIPFNNATEAYFVCGILSCSQVKEAVEARMVSTQISTHVIENIAIPKFDSNNIDHISISDMCREGHKAASSGDTDTVNKLKASISSLAEALLTLHSRNSMSPATHK